ncbi:MAG: hypothetical protein H6936_16530 [Burkholderiales bacterium]|nr:hypothetical protein [Nitrosomonas sp.]MCP5276420.1 hypothetical protein [Burkholderiales bacterium]
MKTVIIKFTLMLLATLWIQNAMAGPSFYSAIVTAEKAGVVQHTNVSAPTYYACEIQKADVINNFIASGFTILNASNCVSLHVRIPELIMPEWHPRWPIPPVCLSCPPWDLGILEVLDPYLAKQVNGLMQEYQIHEYRKELQSLQERYDLKGFDNALQKLDAQQEQFR